MIHRIINTSNAVAALYTSPTTPSMMVIVNNTPCNCDEKNECRAEINIGMKRDRYLWLCAKPNTPTQLLWKQTKRTGQVFGNRTEWRHLFADVESQLPDLFGVVA